MNEDLAPTCVHPDPRAEEAAANEPFVKPDPRRQDVGARKLSGHTPVIRADEAGESLGSSVLVEPMAGRIANILARILPVSNLVPLLIRWHNGPDFTCRPRQRLHEVLVSRNDSQRDIHHPSPSTRETPGITLAKNWTGA